MNWEGGEQILLKTRSSGRRWQTPCATQLRVPGHDELLFIDPRNQLINNCWRQRAGSIRGSKFVQTIIEINSTCCYLTRPQVKRSHTYSFDQAYCACQIVACAAIKECIFCSVASRSSLMALEPTSHLTQNLSRWAKVSKLNRVVCLGSYHGIKTILGKQLPVPNQSLSLSRRIFRIDRVEQNLPLPLIWTFSCLLPFEKVGLHIYFIVNVSFPIHDGSFNQSRRTKEIFFALSWIKGWANKKMLLLCRVSSCRFPHRVCCGCECYHWYTQGLILCLRISDAFSLAFKRRGLVRFLGMREISVSWPWPMSIRSDV